MLTDERARAPNTNINSSTSPVDHRAVGPRVRSNLHGYASAETVSAAKNHLAQVPRTESPAYCPATGADGDGDGDGAGVGGAVVVVLGFLLLFMCFCVVRCASLFERV